MFDISQILKLPAPEDLTLDEMSAFVKSLPWWQELINLVAPSHVSLRYMQGSTEVHGDMTLAEFKALKGAWIDFHIGDGGARSKARVPELV